MQTSQCTQNCRPGACTCAATSRPISVTDCAAFTSSLLNLAVQVNSFGKTSSSIEAVEAVSESEYAIVRR